MLSEQEVINVTNFCQEKLSLAETRLGDEYFYQSLSLCVIDAIYSISVRYESTRNVIKRYCDYFDLKITREQKTRFPIQQTQETIAELLNHYAQIGIEKMTEEVFKNKQRTSAKNGILKGEAVYLFSKILQRYNVNYLQDIPAIIDNQEFANSIKSIPGQGSGISLKYFFMLSGEDNFIKPDRWIIRFIEDIVNREDIKEQDAEVCFRGVCRKLKENYPNLTPRLLDYRVWSYQRENTKVRLPQSNYKKGKTCWHEGSSPVLT